MSNSRSFRRRLAGSRKTRKPRGRFPWGPPSRTTVSRHLRQLEAEGLAERDGVERTGRPGRPAQLWKLTEKGRQRPVTSADELEKRIVDAVNDRRMRGVPYLLGNLRIADPDRAEQLERSLISYSGKVRRASQRRRHRAKHPAGR